jgi:hypothetical protein
MVDIKQPAACEQITSARPRVPWNDYLNKFVRTDDIDNWLQHQHHGIRFSAMRAAE